MIRGGDAEAVCAHYALQKLHILPSVFAAFDPQEKAFVIASILCRVDEEKKQVKKLSKKKR